MNFEEIRKNAPDGAMYYMDVSLILQETKIIGCDPDLITYYKYIDGFWYCYDSGYWFDSECEHNDKFFQNIKPL